MIKNLTRKTIIFSRHRLCTSILSKATGLMVSLGISHALVFVFRDEQRVHLHMLFVFFPIDVILLDSKKRVVEVKENLKPFAFYSSRSKACYAIEVPSGTVRKSRTEIGDKVTIG